MHRARSGSRLYAASWASPTVSNTKPSSHTATPTQTSASTGSVPTAADCSGQATKNTAAPWITNTLRTAAANHAEPSSAVSPPSRVV